MKNLDFKSYFNFLKRNKRYTLINLFGLSLSLAFVILIAHYVLHELSYDTQHPDADRIYIVHNEEHGASAYYLQKHLRDRYPEIESTCAVSSPGQSTSDVERVEVGDNKFMVRVLYADSTFFRFFGFKALRGDRERLLETRSEIVLTESFARQVFGQLDPTGMTVKFPEWEKEYTVSGVIENIDRSVIPEADVVMRAERITELNRSNNEHMGNAGGAVTFVKAREGADLMAKRDDMLSFFREIWWIYKYKGYNEVRLTPVKEAYFHIPDKWGALRVGNWNYVLILMIVGAVILFFAVLNYINLTVAQTGFRAKEMAARRLLGASRGEIFLKLILESLFFTLLALLTAIWMAVVLLDPAEYFMEIPFDLRDDLTWVNAGVLVGFLLLLGVVSGIAPAVMLSRFQPIDVVRGTFRRKSKMVYSRVLIAVQNVITIVMLVAALTIWLQLKFLIRAPLGYNTEDIVEVDNSGFKDVRQLVRYRDELLRHPEIEAVGLGQGTPMHSNNNTMARGKDAQVSFQILKGDSVYFRIFGFEKIVDYGGANCFLNEYAVRELGLDADATNFKIGPNMEDNIPVSGVYRDFQFRTALDKPTSAMLRDYGEFNATDPQFYPWNLVIKTCADHEAAYRVLREVYGEVTGELFPNSSYITDQIARTYEPQRRTLRMVTLFTMVALLISTLGLVAMSTYYIRQKEQEVAVRKVFGSTSAEVLGLLLGGFMRTVGVAFVLAIPVAWYLMREWLDGYSLRIELSWWIFALAGGFTLLVAVGTVLRSSLKAAHADPVRSMNQNK